MRELLYAILGPRHFSKTCWRILPKHRGGREEAGQSNPGAGWVSGKPGFTTASCREPRLRSLSTLDCSFILCLPIGPNPTHPVRSNRPPSSSASPAVISPHQPLRTLHTRHHVKLLCFWKHTTRREALKFFLEQVQGFIYEIPRGWERQKSGLRRLSAAPSSSRPHAYPPLQPALTIGPAPAVLRSLGLRRERRESSWP